MAFIIRFQDKKTNAITYWPKGFGFTSHAHTPSIDEAEKFDSEVTANRHLNGYINPPAFWDSEREHRDNMRRKASGWVCSIIKV